MNTVQVSVRPGGLLMLGIKDYDTLIDEWKVSGGVRANDSSDRELQKVDVVDALLDARFPTQYYNEHLGLQISGLKFQCLNSNSQELELSNFTGLVLGCIKAKICM